MQKIMLEVKNDSLEMFEGKFIDDNNENTEQEKELDNIGRERFVIDLTGVKNKAQLDAIITIYNHKMENEKMLFQYRGSAFFIDYRKCKNNYLKFSKKIFDYIASIDRHLDGPKSTYFKYSITFRELLNIYFEQNGNDNGTVKYYKNLNEKGLGKILDTPVAAIDEVVVDNIVADTEKLLSPKVSDNIKNCLYGALKFGRKRGLIDREFKEHKDRLFRREKITIEALEWNTALELIELLESYQDTKLIGYKKSLFMLELIIMIATGIKFTEAKEFKVENFFKQNGKFYALIDTKTQTNDDIVLSYSEDNLRNRIVPIDEKIGIKIENYLQKLELDKLPNCRIFRLEPEEGERFSFDYELQKLKGRLKRKNALDKKLLSHLTLMCFRYTAGLHFQEIAESFDIPGNYLGTNYTLNTIKDSDIDIN